MTALNRLVLTDAGSFTDLAFGFGFSDADPDDTALTDPSRSGLYVDRGAGYIGVVIDGELAARVYADRVEYGSGASRYLQLLAGEAIVAGAAVFVAADGEVYNAAATTPEVLASAIYIAHNAAAPGAMVQLYGAGSVVRNLSWAWTPGQALYVSTTPGVLSATPPVSGFLTPVAYAAASNVLVVAPESSVATHAAQLTGVHGITPVGSTVITAATTQDARDALELGTASTADVGDFATAAQGLLADTAAQPGDNVTVFGSGTAVTGSRPVADGSGGIIWSAVAEVTSVNGFGGDVVLTAFNVGATEEAPIDGQQYARQNGGWSVVSGGGGGGYILPIASSTVLGGVKIGTGVTIAPDGTLSTLDFALATDLADYLPLAGGTMTGDITFSSGAVLRMQVTASSPSHLEGSVFYDQTEHTLCYYNDVAAMVVNVGQEHVLRVRNNTGATIPDGAVVYVAGALGNRPTIALADNSTFVSSHTTIGVATHNIPHNTDGYITTEGLVNGLDTSGLTEGAILYLGTAGNWTTTEPAHPAHTVRVGYCIRAHPTDGRILVHIDVRQDMSEIDDVVLTTPSTGDLLVYNGVSGSWTNSWNIDDFATAAQGSLADTAVQPGANVTVLGSGTATAGFVASADGAGNIVFVAPGGGSGGISYTVRTSSFTAVPQQGYIIDASANPVTITLPASPAEGAQVWVAVADATYTVTLNRNGELLFAGTDNLTLDYRFDSLGLVFSTAAGWISTTELTNGGAGSSSSGASVIVPITQAAHGFVVGQAIRHNGTNWTLSIASSEATAEVYGVVSEIVDVDNFTVTTGGDIQLSGLTAGQAYFLSPTVPGALTATIPTTIGHVIKPVLLAYSTTKAVVNLMRGNVVQDNAGAFDIANLPVSVTAADTDYVAVSVGGEMRKVALSVIKAGMAAAVVFFGAETYLNQSILDSPNYLYQGDLP